MELARPRFSHAVLYWTCRITWTASAALLVLAHAVAYADTFLEDVSEFDALPSEAADAVVPMTTLNPLSVEAATDALRFKAVDMISFGAQQRVDTATFAGRGEGARPPLLDGARASGRAVTDSAGTASQIDGRSTREVMSEAAVTDAFKEILRTYVNDVPGPANGTEAPTGEANGHRVATPSPFGLDFSTSRFLSMLISSCVYCFPSPTSTVAGASAFRFWALASSFSNEHPPMASLH